MVSNNDVLSSEEIIKRIATYEHPSELLSTVGARTYGAAKPCSYSRSGMPTYSIEELVVPLWLIVSSRLIRYSVSFVLFVTTHYLPSAFTEKG